MKAFTTTSVICKSEIDKLVIDTDDKMEVKKFDRAISCLKKGDVSYFSNLIESNIDITDSYFYLDGNEIKFVLKAEEDMTLAKWKKSIYFSPNSNVKAANPFSSLVDQLDCDYKDIYLGKGNELDSFYKELEIQRKKDTEANFIIERIRIGHINLRDLYEKDDLYKVFSRDPDRFVKELKDYYFNQYRKGQEITEVIEEIDSDVFLEDEIDWDTWDKAFEGVKEERFTSSPFIMHPFDKRNLIDPPHYTSEGDYISLFIKQQKGLSDISS